MVVAVIALFFALGDGAVAAHHYQIISTKQIKPSVLKQLKGARGPRGLQGATGATGSPGSAGAAGVTGATGARGPSDDWEASASSANVTSSAYTLSVTVPAGNYTITAQALGDNTASSGNTGLECWVDAGSEQLTIGYFLVPHDLGPLAGGYVSAVLHTTYTASASTTLTFACGETVGTGTLYIDNPSLSAIQVGTIHS